MFAKPKLSSTARWLSRALVASVVALAAAWADPVKIEFVPPPMEGTLSLGVYDSAGKLVRVLHREAEHADFSLGEDGLRTQWDGKDDQGKDLPAGTYRVKGAAVGDLGVEGVDFIGNDWVSGDDSPHLGKITDLKLSSGTLFIDSLLPGQKAASAYSVTIKPSETPGEDAETVLTPAPMVPLIIWEGAPPSITKGKPFDYGFNHTVWVIDGDSVKQYGIDSTVIRTLATQPGDPAPAKIAASPTEDQLYVLYENAEMQRLCGYDFTGIKPGEAPKVIFENDIVFSASYEQIAPRLKFPDGRPFAPAPVLTVNLVANPLASAPTGKKKPKPPTLALRAVTDKDGAWIVTADGLPLCKVSDTPNLRWAAMGTLGPKKPVTFFTSDGAVVEHYEISAIGNIMLFDAGAHEWTPAAPTPAPSPSPSPAPSATPAEPAPLPPAS